MKCSWPEIPQCKRPVAVDLAIHFWFLVFVSLPRICIKAMNYKLNHLIKMDFSVKALMSRRAGNQIFLSSLIVCAVLLWGYLQLFCQRDLIG